MNELKHIDFNKKTFEANGKEYLIESEISIERAVWKEHFLLQLERGIQPGKQTEDWDKLHSMCFEDKPNDEKLKNISVVAYNNMTGFKGLFENRPPILKLCALFINRPDEDRRFINDALINEKISDWHLEGIAYSSFFFACNRFSADRSRALQESAERYFGPNARIPKKYTKLGGYTHLELIAIWKNWSAVWQAIANNDITQYNALKGMREKEFYNIFEIYEEKLEKLKEQHR